MFARSMIRRWASTSHSRRPHADGKFPPLEKIMLKGNYETYLHSADSVAFWKRLNLFLTVPSLILCTMYVYPQEAEHYKHMHEHPPHFEPFPYMRKRKVQYPFGDGDHTLFSHPLANPDP